jgi:tetratricopeptide (TPR) repeat protein
LNSSGSPEKSRTFFVQALQAAQAAQLEFYAVDAAHMLGIVYKGDASVTWNERAMQMAEAAKDPRARGWLGPLYNNLGWTYADLKRYDEALKLSRKGLPLQDRKEREVPGQHRSLVDGKNDARMLGRVDEALQHQQELPVEPDPQRQRPKDIRAKRSPVPSPPGSQEQKRNRFALAGNCCDDPWLKQDEPQRLERLKQLGEDPKTSLPQIVSDSSRDAHPNSSFGAYFEFRGRTP